MTIKQTTSYTDQAFAHVQSLVETGEFPTISAAVSGVLVRDKERREQAALLLKAELDRRMALPADQWDDWKPGDVMQELEADLARLRDG